MMLTRFPFSLRATLPPAQSTGGQSSDSLREIGQSSLAALSNFPSDAGYSSELEEYIATGDISAVTDFLNSTLDVTISYNLYFYPDSFDGDPFVLFWSGESIGEATSAHYPVALSQISTIPDMVERTHTGLTPGVYDLVLLMWYEPREVPSS